MSFWEYLYKRCKQFLSQCSSDSLERCRWVKFPAQRQSRSKTPKDQLARCGENAAADFLAAKNYTILHKNIRFSEGELDIVAKQNQTLVFVEVKTRKTERFGKPYESVSIEKQRRQVKMANRFIALCRLGSVAVRFDILSIVLSPNQPPKIEHIENAFVVQDL